MVYPFHCDTCGSSVDEVRHASEAGSPAFCPSCKSQMRRVWMVPQVYATVSRPSKVFGIDFANKSAVSDLKKRYNDQTGSNMIEIGNEKPKLKPKLQSYDLPRGVFDR